MNEQHLTTMQALKELQARLPRALAYIAGPYTARWPDGTYNIDKMEERIRIMSECMAKLMQCDITPTSPLLMHLVRMHTKDLPGDWATWQHYSEVTMDKCDYMIVLEIDGWMESVGIAAEREHMQAAGKPIFFIKPQELLTQ